ncbi:hypothetical protein ACFWP3_30090 [Streptomyces sp. NPDC058525]|uniref:hypothetical protein n=1 Tax=Streptomyces sp. NPDC058525 TaxID=3346538 RepID=UPI003649AE56
MKRKPVMFFLLGLFVFIGGAAVVSIRESEVPDRERTLKNSDVVGIWEGSKGGRIELKEDGKVVLSKIRHDPLCASSAGADSLGKVSAEGVWQFGRYPDEGPGVRIEYGVGDSQPAACTIWAVWIGKTPEELVYLLHDDANGERFKRPLSQG